MPSTSDYIRGLLDKDVFIKRPIILTKTSYRLIIIFSIYIVVRILAMIFFPLQDTTEARYAEMARIMAETGDWITPYFDYNVPFWGKPPLVFWLEALSIKLFGVNDFSPRIPSLLLTLATAGIMYHVLNKTKDQATAIWAVGIFMTTLLVFILSGVVILDPIFAFTTTLAYLSFIMVLKEQKGYWGYLFFIAVALGLLSKGPLALVLVGGTIMLWLLIARNRWRVFLMYPWISGLLLLLVITLPWYILAELKTPGFLDYFIVGEHFKRFTDSGWSGDLYGVAHKEPHGMIWVDWLIVSLPWGIIAIFISAKELINARSLRPIKSYLQNEEYSFYLLWALFPMLFFSLSGNVLATYVLPGLPALAIVLAIHFQKKPFFINEKVRRRAMNLLYLVPVLIIIILVYTNLNRSIIRTEKFLIQEHARIAKASEPLFYLRREPFSARYYSKGTMIFVSYDGLKQIEETKSVKSYYLAIPENELPRVEKIVGHSLKKIDSSRLFDLVKVVHDD